MLFVAEPAMSETDAKQALPADHFNRSLFCLGRQYLEHDTERETSLGLVWSAAIGLGALPKAFVPLMVV